jgi:hypothetical protein
MVEFVETFVNEEDVKKVYKVLNNSLQSFLKMFYNKNYFKVSIILGFKKGCYHNLRKKRRLCMPSKKTKKKR